MRDKVGAVEAALGMTDVQKADPAARRHAVQFVVVGAILGALLIVGLERYRAPLLEWFLSEPELLTHRLALVFIFTTVVGSAPLFAFAIYLWSLGSKVTRVQRFPLPEQRVVRDTRIVEGEAAKARGRGFQVLAISLGVAGVMLSYLFWRLVSAIG